MLALPKAAGDFAIDLGPQQDADRLVLGVEQPELLPQHRRHGEPFEIGDEELLVRRVLRHEPDDLTQHRRDGLGVPPQAARMVENLTGGAGAFIRLRATSRRCGEDGSTIVLGLLPM